MKTNILFPIIALLSWSPVLAGVNPAPVDHPTPVVFPATVSISQQPVNTSVCSGSDAFFTIEATGSPSVTYQWQVSPNGTSWTNTTDGATYTGSITSRLTVAASASLNGYSYQCIVTDASGGTASTPAILSVSATTSPFDPAIFQNASTYQCSNNTVGSISGSNSIYSYQWLVSTNAGLTWTTINGGAYTNFTTNVLNFTVNAGFNGNLYQYLISDPTGTGCSATSGLDTFYLLTPPAPQVVAPASGSICPGSNFAFSVPDSAAYYTYQWQSSPTGVSWTNLPNNATYNGSATYSLGITGTSTALRYRTEVTISSHGISCTVASSSAPLSIKTLPAITLEPSNDTLCAGSNAVFKLTASGTTPTYAWQTDNGSGGTSWSPLGITTATLTLTGVTPAMNGYGYEAVVTGACGSPLTTTGAILRVNASGTWLGTTDSSWGNAPNWCGGVPGPTTDVLIPASAPRMPLISTATGTAYSDSLTIQTGAELTISGGTTTMTGPYVIPGTVAYTGTASQQILPANFGSLLISGSGNKTLSGNSAISNTLSLGGSAMLVTGNNILTMNAGSNPIVGPSFSGAPTSWIVTGNGSGGAGNTGTGGLRILQVGASSGTVLFPVGPTTTSYNPLTLSNGGATNGFTVAVNDQYIPGAAAGAVIDRTWLVSAANSGSSNIALGMLWLQTDEPGSFNQNNAAIVRSNGTTLVEQSASGAAVGSDPYTFTGGSFSTLTQFSVGNNSMIVLQLDLLSFSAQWINPSSAGLSWQVDPQYNGNIYEVQRSADEMTFTPIGTVMAVPGITSYTFVDNEPGKNNFYRLQLIDAGGNITYSRIAQLGAGTTINEALLAPSVTTQSSTSLLLSLNHAANIIYMLVDAAGHTVYRQSAWLGAGQHSYTIDLTHLARGVYFVRIIDDQGFSKMLPLIRQ